MCYQREIAASESREGSKVVRKTEGKKPGFKKDGGKKDHKDCADKAIEWTP